nr:MAG TPA: hypothetical protein [Bacteriophage sp.]DAJ56935.1 MAG TPA: hypothetical protein [Caudoviricetes sp.]DAN72637.1 MAG TPA: hypothetical protein [Caudoviricetes sp.]
MFLQLLLFIVETFVTWFDIYLVLKCFNRKSPKKWVLSNQVANAF